MKKAIVVASIVGLFFIVGIVQLLKDDKTVNTAEKPTTQEQRDEATSTPTEQPTNQQNTQSGTDFPRLTEETMDRNFVFSCEGGDTVTLWDNPTDAAGGARSRDKVPCGTAGWAFNSYYNEGLKITFYAVQTNDSRAKNAYGWVTEDLLTWK